MTYATHPVKSSEVVATPNLIVVSYCLALLRYWMNRVAPPIAMGSTPSNHIASGGGRLACFALSPHTFCCPVKSATMPCFHFCHSKWCHRSHNSVSNSGHTIWSKYADGRTWAMLRACDVPTDDMPRGLYTFTHPDINGNTRTARLTAMATKEAPWYAPHRRHLKPQRRLQRLLRLAESSAVL